MSEMYDDDGGVPAAVSKTIKLNDCMKVSKKLGINHDQIAKLFKVKEQTKTWIKNVEKAAKVRNELQGQPLVNYDYVVFDVDRYSNSVSAAAFYVKTPLDYPPNLPVSYCCSYCNAPATGGYQVQYQTSLSQQYVVLCRVCQSLV